MGTRKVRTTHVLKRPAADLLCGVWSNVSLHLLPLMYANEAALKLSSWEFFQRISPCTFCQKLDAIVTSVRLRIVVGPCMQDRGSRCMYHRCSFLKAASMKLVVGNHLHTRFNSLLCEIHAVHPKSMDFYLLIAAATCPSVVHVQALPHHRMHTNLIQPAMFVWHTWCALKDLFFCLRIQPRGAVWGGFKLLAWKEKSNQTLVAISLFQPPACSAKIGYNQQGLKSQGCFAVFFFWQTCSSSWYFAQIELGKILCCSIARMWLFLLQ